MAKPRVLTENFYHVNIDTKLVLVLQHLRKSDEEVIFQISKFHVIFIASEYIIFKAMHTRDKKKFHKGRNKYAKCVPYICPSRPEHALCSAASLLVRAQLHFPGCSF